MRISWKALAVAGSAACVLAWVVGASLAAAATDDSGMAEIRAAEAWAFPVFPPPPDPHASKPDPHKIVHVLDSADSYTLAQLTAPSFIPDWFPQDHPAAPQVVMQHRKPGWPLPCAECHLPTGAGAPASASLRGLPKPYILEQVAAFRAGQRGASAPLTTQDMAHEARSVNDADLQLAAGYFSGMKFDSHVDVVEAATIPKMQWKYFVQVPDKSSAREPIGERIVETPVRFDDYQYGSDRTRFVAWVPPGSIERGAEIASKGTGAAQACESCHGANLQGVGMYPPLAGRSPTYIVRELILFSIGQRDNVEAVPMRLVASQLSVGDMIDVAAYAASRKP